jgi:hypothetical protein
MTQERCLQLQLPSRRPSEKEKKEEKRMSAVNTQFEYTVRLHALFRFWVLSLRNVSGCGCLPMISKTRPLGHRPH